MLFVDFDLLLGSIGGTFGDTFSTLFPTSFSDPHLDYLGNLSWQWNGKRVKIENLILTAASSTYHNSSQQRYSRTAEITSTPNKKNIDLYALLVPISFKIYQIYIRKLHQN